MPRKVILAGAALAAGLALPACGSGAGSAASAPSASCLRQYLSWNSGPEHAAGENLVAALNALQAATSASDIAITAAALQHAAMTARVLERHPLPRCADPRGYWHAVLLRVEDAADKAGTSKGQGTLILAEGALRQMPALERKLAAELRRIVPGPSQSP